MEQSGGNEDTDTLRDRLSRLSEASLRINESLDPDTVLQEVMDNARALTGARFGAITTLDDQGGLLDFITSGLSPEERAAMLALSEGPRLFEYFSSVPGPLRLRDAADHTRALGFPEGQPPVGSLMGTPMRHQGEHVGNLYVAEKEGGGEFTPEDEETLVLFASQAALVVSNARRYRDERRARTRPGGPGQHLAGGRPGVRRQDRGADFDQPGGAPDRQRPVSAGGHGGAAPGGAELPAGRRAGRSPWRSSPWPRR